MENVQKPNDLIEFKDLCFKLGFIMVIFFTSRLICTLILAYIHGNMSEIIGGNTAYILHFALTGVFLYVIPLVAAIGVFKDEHGQNIGAMYPRPPRLVKALWNFPAMYGLGQIVNFAALGIILLISYLSELGMTSQEEATTIARSFGTMNSIVPPNLSTGIFLFIYMVFAAAFFEELLCRGIILNALRPYGNGLA
ncbi:MAG: hypothetical protein FWD35_05760, partial [Oscillospiraceae bacterium]|nr:hypothetical protein [Oscillospiraceae bacterium]